MIRVYVINRRLWLLIKSYSLVKSAYDRLERKAKGTIMYLLYFSCIHSLSSLSSSIPVLVPILPWHACTFDNSKTLVLTLYFTEKHILWVFKWCRSSLFFQQLITAYYKRLHCLTVLENTILVSSKNIILSVQVSFSFNNNGNFC